MAAFPDLMPSLYQAHELKILCSFSKHWLKINYAEVLTPGYIGSNPRVKHMLNADSAIENVMLDLRI